MSDETLIEQMDRERPVEMRMARELNALEAKVERLENELRMKDLLLSQFTHCYEPCSNAKCRCCYAHPGPCDIYYPPREEKTKDPRRGPRS